MQSFPSSDLCDKRLHDMRGITGRQFFLRAFRCFPDSLHGGKIFRQINPCLLFKFPHNSLYKPLIKVIAAQMVVARSSQHFYDSFADLDNGHVKGTSAQVIDHDLLWLAVVQAIGKRSTRRLVNNTLNIKSCNSACVFCRLSLDIIKICRHCNDRFRHFFS